MPEIPDEDWLVRGITEENIKASSGGIKSGEFTTQELSVWIASLDSVRTLVSHDRYVRLAPIKAGYCRRELGLEISDADVDGHASIFVGRKKPKGKRLRDFAEPLSVAMHGSAEEIYEELMIKCDGYDRQQREGD